MQLGMVGFGRMRASMATRLIAAGHEVVGFADRILSAMRFQFRGHQEK